MESIGFFYIPLILLGVANVGIVIACLANREGRKTVVVLSQTSFAVTIVAVVVAATTVYLFRIDSAGDLAFLWAPVFFSLAMSSLVRRLRRR